MDFLIGLLLGLLLGAVITALGMGLRARAGARQMRDAFAALSAEALDASSKRLAEQAGAVLDGKKALVDQTFAAMGERLEQVRELLQKVESQRQQDFGRLTGSVSQLAATTGELHRMLASTQRRGAWGERMAEDVLRLAGLLEGVNYRKQDAQAAQALRAPGGGGRERPDFTFLLPNDLVANMDVKFPLESYKAYLDAGTDDLRLASRRALAGAVRGHVRDVAGRGYVDPEVPTVPYCIVFIPSEQIFTLVMEESPDLMDEALRRRVVLCGPLTLYAMLAVIRQAAENANVVRTADEIVALVAEFCRQWGKYNEEMDKLGQRLDSAAGQYDALRTTRTNVLQKLMDKIDALRSARALPGESPDRPGPAKEAE